MKKEQNIISAGTNTIRILSFLLIILLMVNCSSFNSKDILISKNGNSKVNIVVDENASKDVLFAAEELQKYLKKISGADLKIINGKDVLTGGKIYVGQNKALDTLKVLVKSIAIVL